MEVLHITLITGTGCDTLVMIVDKPNGCWPYNEKACVKMDVAAGGGLAYIKKHFAGVRYSVVAI